MAKRRFTDDVLREALVDHGRACGKFGRAPFPDPTVRLILINRAFLEAHGPRSALGRQEFKITDKGQAFIGAGAGVERAA